MGRMNAKEDHALNLVAYYDNYDRVFAIRLQKLNAVLCETVLDELSCPAHRYAGRHFKPRRLFCYALDHEAGRVVRKAFVVDTVGRASMLVSAGAPFISGGLEWHIYKYRAEYNALSRS